MSSPYQIQMMVPISRTVKALIIIQLAIWVLGVLILQKMVLGQPILFDWFGLVPDRVINEFWLWQPFTYMFLHSSGVTHIAFNMLMLWWLGSELEMRWGQKFFLLYYFVCGVGAAVLYLLSLLVYYFLTNNYLPLAIPVVGASGVNFGLLVAYGWIFSERVIYFMMLFPMRAKYFVMLLGLMEFLMLLDSGIGGPIANLAHIGGLVSGFAFLLGWGLWQTRRNRSYTQKHGRKLKLVVDNERNKESKDGRGPRYWN